MILFLFYFSNVLLKKEDKKIKEEKKKAKGKRLVRETNERESTNTSMII